MLSQHPDVEAEVVAELDELELLVTAERPHPRKPEYADIARLTYLKCMIKVLHWSLSLHHLPHFLVH